jgi:hypothetical protein
LIGKERLWQWVNGGDKLNGKTKRGSAGLSKVSQEEFSKLIEGEYGEVIVLGFDDYYDRHASNIQGSFIHYLNAWNDPLIRAVLGPKTDSFLDRLLEISLDYTRIRDKQEGAEYKILEININDRYGYPLSGYKDFDFPDQPVALLLRFGRISRYENHGLSRAIQIRTQEDSDHMRFVLF